MEPNILTDAEVQLTRERSLKYQGTAKIYINQIVPHPSISRELDPKNVVRLCDVFSRDRCRRLDIRNHVTGIVSRRHLDLALRSAGVSSTSLMTNPPDQFPLLEFPAGQVRCLHGQHRLKAAEELLPPSEQWWTVDLYLEGTGGSATSLLPCYSPLVGYVGQEFELTNSLEQISVQTCKRRLWTNIPMKRFQATVRYISRSVNTNMKEMRGLKNDGWLA